MIFFKSKEERQKIKEEKRQLREEIENLPVLTLHSLPNSYEVVGLIYSGLYDANEKFENILYDLKARAVDMGGNAIIGLTFQTVGYPVEKSEYVGEQSAISFGYSTVLSRLVGTVVRITDDENGIY